MISLYLAAPQKGWSEIQGANILVSFSQPRQLRLIQEVNRVGFRKTMLDSGAFEAWKKGGVLDVERYATYCNKWGIKYDWIIAPDVIGGSTSDNLDNLAQFAALLDKEHGKKLIPVFHEGDDFGLLDACIERGYQYIGLGGTVNRGKPGLSDWLSKCFERHPPTDKLKYHGLGMTQIRVIVEHAKNLYSVDSASWLNLARFGPKDNWYLLKNRSADFWRKVGILAIEDTIANGRLDIQSSLLEFIG